MCSRQIPAILSLCKSRNEGLKNNEGSKKGGKGGCYGPFLVISLMIPAATVVPMSLTAKRPSSSNSKKVSTAIGCNGSILTTAASQIGRASCRERV